MNNKYESMVNIIGKNLGVFKALKVIRKLFSRMLFFNQEYTDVNKI